MEEDQTKPLAPLSLTIRSDQPSQDDQCYDQTKHVHHHHSRTKLILCCGFAAALTLLIAVTFIVLSLTVLHLRTPNLTVDTIYLTKPFDLVNGKVNTNRNATVLVEISLGNPNAASFRVYDVMVSLPYGETSRRRSETIPAKRTVKMNLTAEIVTTKVLTSIPRLMEDLNGQGVDLRNSVEVIGKVKILKIFKKSIHLKTDCSMNIMNNSLKPTKFSCLRT